MPITSTDLVAEFGENLRPRDPGSVNVTATSATAVGDAGPPARPTAGDTVGDSAAVSDAAVPLLNRHVNGRP